MFKNSIYTRLSTGLLLSSVLLACGAKYKDSIQPIYQAQNLQLKNESVQYWSTINPTTVDPSAIQQVVQNVFGWIPVVGGVIELPVDLTFALIPPVPSTSFPELPKDAAWDDPRILKIVKGMRLAAGSIRITPRELRGKDWKPEKCWVFWDCPDVQIDDFLTEVRVYLVFKDLKKSSEATVASPQILLASAQTSTDYNRTEETLYFNVSQENIRPYLDQYAKFDVKLVASGKYPDHKVYLDGKLRLDLDLSLSNE